MTETRPPYAAGPPEPEQPDLAAIEARLAAATDPPFDLESWQVLHGHAPADLRALVAEVRRLRAELRTLVERSIDDQWGCPLCPEAGDYDSSGDFWHEDDCTYDQLIPNLELSK